MATVAEDVATNSNELGRELEKVADAVKQTSGAIAWRSLSKHVAWFDRPDAHDHVQEQLSAGKITLDEKHLLRNWIDDGCLALEKIIPERDIDEVNPFMDDLMRTDVPNPDITHYLTAGVDQTDHLVGPFNWGKLQSLSCLPARMRG